MEKEKENGLSGIYFLLKKWLLSGASELQAVPPATSVAAPAAVSLSEQKKVRRGEYTDGCFEDP